MKTIKKIGIVFVICAFLEMIIFIILNKIIPWYCEWTFIAGLILVYLSSLTITLNYDSRNDKKNKIDKGKEWNYYKLSYRRRFIRTLWFDLFAIFLGIFLSAFCENKIFIIIYWDFLILGSVFQLGFNYIGWKKEKNTK